ncbi:MAG: biopolymer transporter ExbD [Deferribacteraceae bacterium]|jgi:biopolymer transport protein ExbD|nr:biopolymer transporter ExbD [Deferribacteraceae bacterium]
MKFRHVGASSKPSINITPLLDIVFILLIFFAVSTSFMFVGAIEVDLPKANTTTEGQASEVVRVVVTRDNQMSVDQRPISAEELRAALDEAIAANPSASLVIEADTSAMHGAVVQVIDAGKAAGFVNFAIATDQE